MKGTVTVANTYAACVEQPAARIFYSIAAQNNLRVYGADCSNAFAEAPPPTEPLYMKIDKQFRDWWTTHKHRDKLPEKDLFVKVQHAIQGHPEAPRLWQIFIDGILIDKMGFRNTTHEKCLYVKCINGENVYLLRQVDDVAIASKTKQTAEAVISEIGSYMKSPIKHEGLTELFNGVDVQQTRDFIKVHSDTYLQRVVKRHGHWMRDIPVSNEPHTMTSTSDYARLLEADESATIDEIVALEEEFQFKYRSATGELIFALVTTRPDISFPVIKLCQYNGCPGRSHFEAVKKLLIYLRDTSTDGIYFWRKEPNMDLPAVPAPLLRSETYTRTPFPDNNSPLIPFGVADSDWASDTTHRKSVSGMGIIFGGAVVAYKSRYQKTIADSSTEAEFYALVELGKMLLYLRSVLDDLGIPQDFASVIYEDNKGVIDIVNSGKPTKRARHVDTKQFCMLDWVETDLLEVVKVSTHDNPSDTFTKALPKILFHRHNEVLMGKVRPEFSSYQLCP